MAGGVGRIVISDSDIDDAPVSSTKVLALPSVARGVLKWVPRDVPECKKGLLCSRTNISPLSWCMATRTFIPRIAISE